jgi:molecular chaperone GrpE
MIDESLNVESSQQEPATEVTEPSKPHKHRHSKVQQLQEENTALKQELEQTKELMLRQAADFDNFRKRKQKESLELLQYARENFLKELLPIVDDFNRFLQTIPKNDDVQWQGVKLIHEKLTGILKSQGLVAMEPVGKPFDPEFHDALITVPREDVPPGTVVEVHENGYMMNGKVLRHAKVIVSKEKEQG